MRWVISTLVVLALPSSAFAADLDILRGAQSVGPANFPNWSGFYVGGQASYSDANVDFSGATQPLVAYSLRELALENEQHPSQWPILGKVNADGAGFGGFAGYNTQWQDLVVGVEANYTRSSFSTTASVAPIGREVAAGGNTYDVNVSGTGTLDLIDYTSLRARAGAIYGNFLPYGFVGFVLGRANYSLTTLVSGQQNPSTPPVVPCDTTKSPSCVDFSFSNSAGQSSAFMYGVSLGGGLDFAVTQNIFLRGEFEYIRFAPISDIVVSIASARVGAGVKF